MENNDNTAAQMLLFPIQEKPFDDCVEDHELITQFTLRFTSFVNMVRTGQINPSERTKEEVRAALKSANEILSEVGYKPIYSDF